MRILDFSDGLTSATPPSETEIPISVLKQEVPTGAVNGVNAAFVISDTPISADNVIVSVDGVIRPESEWSLSGTTVTFGGSHIPATGQNVYILFMVEAAPSGGGGGGGSSLIDAHGSQAAPVQVTPASGLTPSTENDQVWFIAPLSGGATPITANPQIAAGTDIGQRLIIKGTSASDYYTFAHGTGLDLNGPILLTNNQSVTLTWGGTSWTEDSRRA